MSPMSPLPRMTQRRVGSSPSRFAGSVLMLCGYLGAVACFGAEGRNNTPAGRVP